MYFYNQNKYQQIYLSMTKIARSRFSSVVSSYYLLQRTSERTHSHIYIIEDNQ